MPKVPHNPLDGPKSDLSITTVSPPVDDKVSFIVVHHDRPEYLNIYLQSIAVTCSNNNYEIIVVDSGSTRTDAINYLQDLEESNQCKVIRKKENIYWSAAANAGAKAADKDSKYFIFSHDDNCIINGSVCDLLINVSDGEKSGLVGVSKHGYMRDQHKFEFIEEYFLMSTRECHETIGGWNEDLPIVGAAFLYTLGAHHGGFKPQVLQTPLVHHYANFSIDINEFEKATFDAMDKLPKLMTKIQSDVTQRIAKKAINK